MRWRGGEIGARLALVLLLAGCSTNILHGVDERSANEATAALERAGIGAEKLPDESAGTGGASFTIRVAHGDAGRAVDLLHALGLPRPAPRSFAQTYGQPSLIPTPSEEHARYLDALAGEIERTLESADGVVSARVHLVLEEADPLALDGKPRNPARAAVLLKARRGRAPLDEDDVRKLVSGSVAGLAPAAVSVVMIAAAAPAETAPLASVGPLRVTPGTRPLLLAALIIALAVLALLSVLLLITARRLSTLEASERASRASPSTERRGSATPAPPLGEG
jgi:type III secretion protein J